MEIAFVWSVSRATGLPNDNIKKVSQTIIKIKMQGNNIRSSTYSNIHVYEMSVRGTAVMIRKSDGFVNATQILRAAGFYIK